MLMPLLPTGQHCPPPHPLTTHNSSLAPHRTHVWCLKELIMSTRSTSTTFNAATNCSRVLPYWLLGAIWAAPILTKHNIPNMGSMAILSCTLGPIPPRLSACVWTRPVVEHGDMCRSLVSLNYVCQSTCAASQATQRRPCTYIRLGRHQ